MEKTRSSNNYVYGTVNHLLTLELEEPVRLEMTECLNQLLADTADAIAERIQLLAVFAAPSFTP